MCAVAIAAGSSAAIALFYRIMLFPLTIINGADVVPVSEHLGHSGTAVMLRMYAHASEESIRRAGQIVLINQTRKANRVPELPISEALMNAAQTQRKRQRYQKASASGSCPERCGTWSARAWSLP